METNQLPLSSHDEKAVLEALAIAYHFGKRVRLSFTRGENQFHTHKDGYIVRNELRMQEFRLKYNRATHYTNQLPPLDTITRIETTRGMGKGTNTILYERDGAPPRFDSLSTGYGQYGEKVDNNT